MIAPFYLFFLPAGPSGSAAAFHTAAVSRFRKNGKTLFPVSPSPAKLQGGLSERGLHAQEDKRLCRGMERQGTATAAPQRAQALTQRAVLQSNGKNSRTKNIFSMKRTTFQTARPDVPPETLFFPVSPSPGNASRRIAGNRFAGNRKTKGPAGRRRDKDGDGGSAADIRPDKARWGRDGGPGGKTCKNAFPSERLGPLAPAATGWRPQAVPVATKEATGIDSRDEGFPFPPEKPYGLSFRGKSAVFPLTPGRAALCRRLRVSPFSKLKRSNVSWSRRGRSCRFSGNWPELRRAGQRGVFFPGRRRRPRGGRRPAREQIRGGLRERRGGHPGRF